MSGASAVGELAMTGWTLAPGRERRVATRTERTYSIGSGVADSPALVPARSCATSLGRIMTGCFVQQCATR